MQINASKMQGKRLCKLCFQQFLSALVNNKIASTNQNNKGALNTVTTLKSKIRKAKMDIHRNKSNISWAASLFSHSPTPKPTSCFCITISWAVMLFHTSDNSSQMLQKVNAKFCCQNNENQLSLLCFVHRMRFLHYNNVNFVANLIL